VSRPEAVHRHVGVVPFLRWPGGKRWLSTRIADLIQPELSKRYIEPFLGSGAVFFRLVPQDALLADVNRELIATFRAIRSKPSLVRAGLSALDVTREQYEFVRTWRPKSMVEQAVRLLYLNRTAFSGIYRLNRHGEFNVPYGGGERTPAMLIDSNVLVDASRALQRAKIVCRDFEPIIDEATQGDVVYCDPTYTAAHNNNGFVRYNERNFSWADQERLSVAVYRAKRRGVVVLVSNADHSEVRSLYRRSRIATVERFCGIPANSQYRRTVEEVLITV
jgi:DNA adenine methylase